MANPCVKSEERSDAAILATKEIATSLRSSLLTVSVVSRWVNAVEPDIDPSIWTRDKSPMSGCACGLPNLQPVATHGVFDCRINNILNLIRLDPIPRKGSIKVRRLIAAT
ncbi:hypothetical protein FACS1894185_0380 [Betaproteobacteria bacterium]|nr:hypothetical protein FACS1894185_0380 [Betaproteobacteria bacterium]